MNLAELWAEIEEDQYWRDSELRFFHNRLSVIEREEDKAVFRKALVVMLYAHFEGFCKFALTHYVKAVNAEALVCSQVSFAIAAASLADVLSDLRNATKKAKEFTNTLPDDAKLHRFALEREFVERTSLLDGRLVQIPDDYIDTESNLKPVVLSKNLYRIGLKHDAFSKLDGQINKLLNFRNNVSHGSNVPGLEKKTYDTLRSDVSLIMTEVKRSVMQSLENRSYLRVASRA